MKPAVLDDVDAPEGWMMIKTESGSVGLVPEDYLGPPPRKGLSEDEKELQRAKASAAKAQAELARLRTEMQSEMARVELEKREAQLSELLSHSNVDAASIPQINRRWDDVIELKNQSVRDLQQSLGGLITQHNEMVQHYERKMLAYGIPVEELGFMPQMLTMPQTLK